MISITGSCNSEVFTFAGPLDNFILKFLVLESLVGILQCLHYRLPINKQTALFGLKY